MKTVRNTVLNVFATFMAWVVVAAICIVPITIVLGCIRLIMMMFGV